MRRTVISALLAGAVAIGVAGCYSAGADAQSVSQARFTSSGAVMIPQDWREWVFVGTPLTPNALNGGKAPFPEFHNVYIEPSAYAHWKRTGKFANGTQIAKELVFIRKKDKSDMNKDGSTAEVSGIGYF